MGDDNVKTNGLNGSAQVNGTRCSTSSILNDPIKLIRLYSKFNAMKAQNGYFSFSSCGSEESLASLHITNNVGIGKNGDVPRPTTPRQQIQQHSK